jgi:hypothetical protein
VALGHGLWRTKWHWDTVCGGQSGTGTRFVVDKVALGHGFLLVLRFSRYYHSIIALWLFIYLSPTLHNLSNLKRRYITQSNIL